MCDLFSDFSQKFHFLNKAFLRHVYCTDMNVLILRLKPTPHFLFYQIQHYKLHDLQ